MPKSSRPRSWRDPGSMGEHRARAKTCACASICVGDNDIRLEPDQLCRKFTGAIAASLGPAILNRKVATFDPAEFYKDLIELVDAACSHIAHPIRQRAPCSLHRAVRIRAAALDL